MKYDVIISPNRVKIDHALVRMQLSISNWFT